MPVTLELELVPVTLELVSVTQAALMQKTPERSNTPELDDVGRCWGKVQVHQHQSSQHHPHCLGD